MSSERIEEVKITIPVLAWVIVITVLLTVVGNIFVYFLPFPFTCNMNAGDLIATPGVDLLGIPFMVTLIVGALMSISSIRRRLTTANLMLLYVVALASSAFANQDSPWREAFEPVIARVGTDPAVMAYVPEFVSPPREAAEALIRGTGSITAIPWSQLLPAIIWRFFTFAFFAGISVGLISIFRRQWIDIERLAYPQVAAAYNAIVGVGEVRNPKWTGRTTFILGFIIGFGLEFIRACTLFFPWFPDIYSWRTNTCGPGTHQLSFPGTTWHYGLAKHTPFYALLLLAPLHSLFSVVFWGIVYEVASAIAVTLGYYTGYVDMGHCGKSWCGQNTPYAEPPLAFGSLIVGVTLGVFVMTIFHERHHIMTTLKIAFGGAGGTEAEEPMSYRTAWLIFIGSFILGIIVFMVAGMSLWASFVVILTGVVTWFTTSQLWGRIGFSNEPGYNFGPGFAKIFLWPTEYALPVTNTDRVLAHTYVYELASHRPSVPWCTTFYTVLGSYKMASLMRIHPRNVIKIASVSLIIAMIVACMMNVILPGVYGMGRTTCYTTTNLMGRVNHMWSVPSPRPMVDIAPWVAGGFVFMVIMSLLHVRFLWMPDPVMSIIAWDWIGGLHGTWMASLIILIIKWLILRIGGSKLYEEKAVPFVGGFILGAALNALVAGIGAFIIYRPV